MEQNQTGYGVDIAVRRADDLDKAMLFEVAQKVADEGTCTVLDLGCGGGGQSVRLATAGACVLGVDVSDFSEVFSKLRFEHELSEKVLRFIQADLRRIDSLLGGQRFDICCFQRAVHYLPYAVARTLLSSLRLHIKGRLYISATGLGSAVGEVYTDREEAMQDRFCSLDTHAASTFSIHEPLCLYTPTEFEELLTQSGWSIERSWVSAFGNVKAVCR